MIGLDTNVLARLFVDDDPAQAKSARKFFAEHCSYGDPGFVDRVALCELVWVLTSVHGYDRAAVAMIIRELLRSSDIRLEDDEVVRDALPIFETQGVDFADVLIGLVNRAAGCAATATFDRKAAKLDCFMRVE